MVTSTLRVRFKQTYLEARPVAEADLKFWKKLYSDVVARRQLYAAPTNVPAQLWAYLQTGQKSFTVWQGRRRVGGFLLAEVAPYLGTFSIVVLPSLRGKGYGRAIMMLIEAAALEEGYTTLRADVYLDNAASIALLEGIGFRQFMWLEKNLNTSGDSGRDDACGAGE